MERVLRLALLATFVALPFSTSRDSALGGVLSFALPLLAAFAVLYAFRVVLSRRVVAVGDSRKVLVAAILYAVFVNVSVLVADEVGASLLRAAVHLLGLPLALFIGGVDTHSVRNLDGRARSARLGLILFGALLSGYFLINLLVQVRAYGSVRVFSERYVGGLMELPWGATNVIAAALLFPIFMSAVELGLRKGVGRVAPAAALLIMLLGVLFTFSRNVTLCLLLGFIGYNLRFGGVRGAFKVVVLPVLLGVVFLRVAGLFMGRDMLSLTISSRVDERGAGSFGGRTEIWSQSLDWFAQHPFSMMGYYDSLRELGHTSHNWALTHLLEVGIVGLAFGIAVLVTLYGVLRRASRGSRAGQVRPEVRLYTVALLVYVLSIQFEDSHFVYPTVVAFWAFAGLCINVYRRSLPEPAPRVTRTAPAPLLMEVGAP